MKSINVSVGEDSDENDSDNKVTMILFCVRKVKAEENQTMTVIL